MCSFSHGSVCCHSYQINLTIYIRCQKEYTFSKLFFQLVALFTQFIHIDS